MGWSNVIEPKYELKHFMYPAYGTNTEQYQ